LVEIPPGVQPIADCRLQIADCSEKSAIYNLQSVITCVGPLEPHKGFHDALWAINILRYAAADVYLRIAGKGSDSGRLAAFVRTVCLNNHVHLLGEQEDVTNLLKQAQMVWVPSQTSGGINVLLEAMATGKPVVASALPELAEIVRDGETGLLFPPGDAAALARQTRRLLDDGECRRLLGEAGQRRAAACFPVSAMVEAFVRLYHDG
jgi:glycosyltransferase involved in cell wall biosynthesis